jgi:hypothetical protein
MISREYTVWCDHSHEEEDADGDIIEIKCSVWMQTAEATNKKHAEKIFKSWGWKIKSKKWICPACAEGFIIQQGNLGWNPKTEEWKRFTNLSCDVD